MTKTVGSLTLLAVAIYAVTAVAGPPVGAPLVAGTCTGTIVAPVADSVGSPAMGLKAADESICLISTASMPPAMAVLKEAVKTKNAGSFTCTGMIGSAGGKKQVTAKTCVADPVAPAPTAPAPTATP